MRIGLVDVDGHNFPNLALMKLSTYHKQLGDTVEWANSLEPFDKIYMAKVFTFTKDDNFAYQCDDVVRGGTGYDLTSKLPDDVEGCYPDYSLYNIKNTAYGYLTRGCPRGCSFCVVAKKEGQKSYKVANLENFWSGQKGIKLLDPNLLACAEWKDLMQQLIDSHAYVDFTQGVDIRLMTDEKAEYIRQCKVKMIHFAWDNPNDLLTLEKLKQYVNAFGLTQRKLSVYVLTNFSSTTEQDLWRVNTLRELGYTPYVMIYDKLNAPKITRLLQRYVNNRYIFWSTSFKQYLESGHKK